MTFNLSGLHLGDVLLAMPAMRAGDRVIVAPQYRVPGLPVEWMDAGAGIVAHNMRGRHSTDAWLLAACREPVRHALLPPEAKTLTVIAPDAADPTRQWGGWEDLRAALPRAAWIGADLARDAWMALLNRAHTVICPDTGTAHMADALGARVVGLYGAKFDTHAPYWSRAHCVARASMAAITLDDVLERVNG